MSFKKYLLISDCYKVFNLKVVRKSVSHFVIPAKSAAGPPAAEDPDNVPAKAGNQTSNDVIELSLW